MDKLPVLFRRPRGKAMFENDGVTAVFPTLGWASRYDMTCYAHVGQHGACDMGWYNMTIAAKPEEYKDLLAELSRIYSNPNDPDAVELVVYKRITPQHRKARQAA